VSVRWWVAVAVLLALVAIGVSTGRDPRPPAAVERADVWGESAAFAIRVVRGGRVRDVDLLSFRRVEGRVAYEGPQIGEGVENWKPSHVYSGVELRSIITETVGLQGAETVTVAALDGWRKTLPIGVLDGTGPCGTVALAVSIDGVTAGEWEDAPMLVFLPEDERFSNQDMVDVLGDDGAHRFGTELSTTGMMVKGALIVIIDHDGGRLPTTELLVPHDAAGS